MEKACYQGVLAAQVSGDGKHGPAGSRGSHPAESPDAPKHVMCWQAAASVPITVEEASMDIRWIWWWIQELRKLSFARIYYKPMVL